MNIKIEAAPGVYVIECGKTLRVYVGSSINMRARLDNHFSMLRRGKHGNKEMQHDWNQTGGESFYVQATYPCEKDRLGKMELDCLATLISEGKREAYNCLRGETMEASGKGKRRGRPRLGNILFARRLSPERIKQVEAFLNGSTTPSVQIPAESNAQLLKSYEAVWDEKEAVYAKLQEVLDNPRDEVATYWKNKYEELAERAKALEALS